VKQGVDERSGGKGKKDGTQSLEGEVALGERGGIGKGRPTGIAGSKKHDLSG